MTGASTSPVNCLELSVVLKVLEYSALLLTDKHVIRRTDNKTAVAYKNGQGCQEPFVVVTQILDTIRVVYIQGKHIMWTWCHVGASQI